jgi:oligoendopeptidase F
MISERIFELKGCQRSLQQWVRKTVHKADEQIRQKTCELENIQKDLSGQNIEAEKLVKDELHTLLEEEDLKWRQRAKENWLKLGDRNTKFFHACANQRSRSNMISQVVRGWQS